MGKGFVFSKIIVQSFFFSIFSHICIFLDGNGCSLSLLKPAALSYLDSPCLSALIQMGDISLFYLLFLCWIQITEILGRAILTFGCNLGHCDKTIMHNDLIADKKHSL